MSVWKISRVTYEDIMQESFEIASISSEFYRRNKKENKLIFRKNRHCLSHWYQRDNINENKALASFAIFIRSFRICYIDISIKATSVPRNHSTEKRGRSIVRYESSRSTNRYVLRVNCSAIWMHLIYFSRQIYEIPHVSIILSNTIRKKLTNRNLEPIRFLFSLCSKYS